MLDKKTLLYLMSKMRKRDSQTHEHSYSAAGYAVECARYMHLPKDVIRRLYYGMLLHDIGKIQISLDILNKKEVLTKKERWKIEKHPEYGHAIVTTYNPHKDILDIILYHHERWDGEGYPHKLKGEEIPFLARIAAVADAYDAIVSNRPYKKAVTPEEAIQEIIDHAGTQFDPQIADNFCRSFEKKNKTIDGNVDGKQLAKEGGNNVKKIYINSALKTIDDALCEQFEKHTCSDIEESSIVVVSKKNTKPENIRSLTGGGKRKVILLADMSDTDLIKAARDANAEIFYSPVKIPELSKKISEMLDIEQPGPDTGKQQEVMENKGQPEKKTQDTPKPAEPADAYTEKDLTDLMQQIKSRMTGSGELEQLRKENQELKEKVKRYETFISVLADIFNTTVN